MKHNFLKFSKNIGLYGMAMLIGFSMFTSNCGGDDDNPVDDSDTEVTDTTTTTADPMVFTSFSPGTGSYGDEITIYGENFDGDVEVTVNDKLQEDIVSVNDDGTELVFTLASNTYSGTVVLSRDGENDIESEDEFIYETTYDVAGLANFNDDEGGRNIEFLEDGSYYLTYNTGLIKHTADGQNIVIIEATPDPDVSANGLFRNNGVLYIADYEGRILTYDENTEVVDTLVKDVSDDIGNKFIGITGDDEYLYLTNRTGFQLVRVEIANPDNVIELIDLVDDAAIGITISGDTLYAATNKGGVKLHKSPANNQDFTYFIEKGSESFATSDIAIHPSGDILITDADADSPGLYIVSGNTIQASYEDLDYQGIGLFDGDIYLVSVTKVKKIEVN